MLKIRIDFVDRKIIECFIQYSVTSSLDRSMKDEYLIEN